MSEHPIVYVGLNSGTYKGRLQGKVSAFLRGDRSAYYAVELLDHPTLKTVNVKRNQIVGTVEKSEESS